MEKSKIKCSSKKHLENDAIAYCQECRIYLCNKCEKLHSELFEYHHPYKLDKDISDLFTGFCQEPNHLEKLSFFCKSHNQLCCSSCITKLKDKIYGKHADCEVCFIDNIKEEKKSKLEENIKHLEELSKTLDESINKLKQLFEKMNEKKEDLKLKIQKIFTQIRNAINDREDNLLIEVDNIFNKYSIKEETIRESNQLPNKIKESLDKGKNIDKKWSNDNNDLKYLINDCLNIEKNIKSINMINEDIEKHNSNDLKFEFYHEDINNYIGNILKFGSIYIYKNFGFKACPINISEERKYTVSGEFKNILTKTGTDYKWMGTICINKLEKEENKWKIKILKTKYNMIMVGVAPIDFDIEKSSFLDCGWYYSCNNSSLYSGPPHNYDPIKDIFNIGKEEEYQIKNYEITIIMNISKRTIKFIVNVEDKGELYTNIPADKSLHPAVFLIQKENSVEISNY
jgi:hypothetical protein